MAAVVRRGSAAGKSIVPYCAMLVDNCVGLWFSYLIGDAISVQLRLLGLLLNASYLAVLVAYAPPGQRTPAVRTLGLALAGLAAFYAVMSGWVPAKARPDILGLVNTGTALAFASSPLADISGVLKARDASSIPFAMASALTVCASSWATYGVITRNIWMVIPNVLNALIGGAQVGLSLAFRPGPAAAAGSAGRGGSKGARASGPGGSPQVEGGKGAPQRAGMRSRAGVTSPPGQRSSEAADRDDGGRDGDGGKAQ
jgi:solute carrier family 50 protein (sugar transporter)